MTTPRLLLFGLLGLLCWPTAADAQQSRRDRAEQQIRDRCGDDRACAQRMRDELRQQRPAEGAPATDRPERTRPGAATPGAAQAAFDALPPDVQREMQDRCGDDRACLRRAMRRYRQQSGATPAPPPAATDGPSPRSGELAPDRTRVPIERTRAGEEAGTGAGATGATRRTTTGAGAGAPAPPPPGSGQGIPPGFGGSGPPVITNDRPRGAFPEPADDEPAATPAPTGLYYDADETSLTLVSGYSGTEMDTRRPGNGAVLLGMYAQEDSDVPCAFLFFWYRNNDADVRQGHFTTEASRCGAVFWADPSGRPLASVRSAYIPFITDAELGQIRAVRSLQVCVNRDDDRIKGVRVEGAHIDEDGRVTGDGTLDGEYERPNCHDWRTERTCPSGEVAVGVELDYNVSSDFIGGSALGASGMRLICADPYTE